VFVVSEKPDKEIVVDTGVQNVLVVAGGRCELVTVAVPMDQVENLIAALSTGTARMVLRAPDDKHRLPVPKSKSGDWPKPLTEPPASR
jgi:hypothetical protein